MDKRRRTPPTTIVSVHAERFEAPMKASFEIAGGSLERLLNVLVCVRLKDGSTGWGECAPFKAYNGETQAGALRAARAAAGWLTGFDAGRHEALAEALEGNVRCASARAGLEMAALDAWARSRSIPLWTYFGGAGRRLRIDITVPIVPPRSAAALARAIRRFGVRALKVKVGREAEADAARVAAAAAAARPSTLIVDGNAGYSPREALRFLRLLAELGIRPDLFEQPVAKDDLDGMAEVARKGGSTVAADESAATPADVLRLARKRAAGVVNLKLMKAGIRGSWAMARAARSAGLGLMIGGNVESHLSMTCSAHLAAGFGGFRFVDLDTPLLLSKDPTKGVRIRRGGIYDLSGVRAGIGVEPR
jgi:L-alanine-DL-glutamate epimerase-like enolase superfamily enzyme